MLKVNEYFDGRVKSIAADNSEGRSTVGVIAPGEYEFSTSTVEIMMVITGHLDVQFPDGDGKWFTYKRNQTFTVQSGSSFKVKTDENTGYICFYK